ncbi:MAG TPA: hypothetical protein VFX12_09985 [Vicinamibacterales bacterium]|nr:hypothetical protein [Vicinamibacterales bacterium]
MQSIKSTLAAVVGFAILVGAFQFAQPATVKGDPIKDMLIVNTPAEPVPTTIQGTVAVNGAISGTIDARQSGPWGMSILNAPTVGIDPLRNTVKLATEGAKTAVLLNANIVGMPVGGQFLDPIDVSGYAKVRISGTINGSGDITFTLLSDPDTSTPHNGLLLDTFTSGGTFTKVYDVPGVFLIIQMSPESANNQAILTLYGH